MDIYYQFFTDHHQKKIGIYFKYNQEKIAIARSLGAAWSNKQQCWHMPCSYEELQKLKKAFPEIVELNKDTPNRINSTVISHKALEVNTIHAYQAVKGRLRLMFPYYQALIEIIKEIPYAQFDKTNKWWNVPDSEKVKNTLLQFCQMNQWQYQYHNELREQVIKPKIQPYEVPNYRRCPDAYLQKLQIMRYSPNTIKHYCDLFEEFINFYPGKKVDEITEPEIVAYTRYLVVERGIGASYQNQAINAIKFYYEKVLGGQRKLYQLQRPQKEQKLPIVLNEQEVKRILQASTNTKHRALLTLCYSTGMRLSELINLKIKDIDSINMQVWIRGGKGKKDRFSLLSHKALDLLREYFKEYQPKEYLFEGQRGGPYSARSTQQVLTNACIKAQIKKEVSIHSLRHSFATHMLEHGTDIRYIQALLGHKSSKTTEIYTHITTKGMDKIKSPLDHLDI